VGIFDKKLSILQFRSTFILFGWLMDINVKITLVNFLLSPRVWILIIGNEMGWRGGVVLNPTRGPR